MTNLNASENMKDFLDIDLPEVRAPYTLEDFLAAHVAKHVVGPVSTQWPDSAVYYVQYGLKAWPCDFSHHEAFFDSAEELSKWYRHQLDWAKLEDNYFRFDALYMWDLGPQLIFDIGPHVNAC